MRTSYMQTYFAAIIRVGYRRRKLYEETFGGGRRQVIVSLQNIFSSCPPRVNIHKKEEIDRHL